MFKKANGIESIKLINVINYSNNTLNSQYHRRKHTEILHREQAKNCLSRFYFLTNRVVNHWNKLPDEIVRAKNLNSFKEG